jgi:hypothetical protein
MLNNKSTKGPSHLRSPPVPPSIKVELDQRDAQNFETLLDFIYAPAAQQMMNLASNDGSILTAASTLTSPSLFSLPQSSSHRDEDGSQLFPPSERAMPAAHTASRPEEYVKTSSAVSLRYLARKFQVDTLILHVNRFIQRDMSFKTGPFYLTQGWEYGDERLVTSAQRLCAENFTQLDVEALVRLPPHLFRVVAKSLETFECRDDDKHREMSEFLSNVVYRYMDSNYDPQTLPADVLLELTDPILMPYIASDSAIGFTALVKKLESSEASKHWDGLASLCRRCARAVVQEYGWNDFSVSAAVEEYLGNSQSHKRVSKVDSLLFATSFAAALEQAQDDFEDFMLEQERLEQTIKILHNSITAMEDMNDRKNSYISKQQEVIDDAKRQILQLKQQVTAIRKAQQHQQLQRGRGGAGGASPPVLPSSSQQHPQASVYTPPQVKPPPPVISTSSPQEPSASQHRVNVMDPSNEAAEQQQQLSSHMPSTPKQQQQQPRSFTTEEIVRDLISPSEVEGAMMALRQSRRQRDMRTREELRAKKSLV